jgi:urease accessory protein
VIFDETSLEKRMISKTIKEIGFVAALALLIALLSPSAANAHPIKGVGDFYAGMLHPLTALEFVLPWIALSLFAGQQGRKAALLTLAIFPFALASGAALVTTVQLPAWLPAMNLAIIPILGMAVALAISCPSSVVVILVTIVGLLHGLANGSEITAPVSAWRFIPGLATVAILVLAYGIGLVRSLKTPWTRIAVRVAGSWIAAVGIMICAFKF